MATTCDLTELTFITKLSAPFANSGQRANRTSPLSVFWLRLHSSLERELVRFAYPSSIDSLSNANVHSIYFLSFLILLMSLSVLRLLGTFRILYLQLDVSCSFFKTPIYSPKSFFYEYFNLPH